VSEQDDLAMRAARALQDESASRRGVTIGIEKRIPMGAGLGGGSSDAASVLLGLNRMWRAGLARDELARIGAKLGADVPFFVFGEPAMARGIGDELVAVTLPRYWIALIVPPVHVATASVFAARELTRNTPSAKMDVFSESYGRNDLQPVAAARFPAVAAALSELGRHGPEARMTGSGACVFARFTSRGAAEAAVASTLLHAPAMHGMVVRVLGRHPLADFA
jgi:4-diphosphocytidyl-2-C-methyl-D-erythritol kinase